MEFKTSKYDFEEGNVMGEPVSPSSQSLSTSVMTLGINIILEFEQPIPDIDCTLTRLADALLPKNPLFSCILTVNDVMCGIIFSGFQRYVQISLSTGEEQSLEDAHEKRSIPNDTKKMNDKRATALTMINTRILTGLENLEEMMKSNTQVRWGNHYAMLQVPIPLKNMENPLEFIKMAKCTIDRQKMSFGVFATTKILGYLGRFRGAKALAKCAYKTIASSTMIISNMIGPKEKIAIDGNIVKRFSFYVSGGPITLATFIISYMDTITVQVLAQKDYINIDVLLNLFREAFEEINEASIHGI
ncbi:wax ester synthase/diacylglycerol acyltransferase 11 isoform X2 [Cryptomeria japonica]|uniref:wax ester synthase/diacylglycerol acyltransferase 11 isoform X2 n=1 Tax=Cryptomeria japonica TaxID=3369 RepID=UPI0027DA4198|nr:wax ester synthase/diacylglycerol acyltransferase 11 isoform X2 [Cryptomeria japonica]